MVCKVLFFDTNEDEKNYLDENKSDYFHIEYFGHSLNKDSLNCLKKQDYEDTVMISVRPHSRVSEDIIKKFENLRLIASRAQEYNYIDWRYCLNNNIALINVETNRDDSTQYILKNSFAGMTDFLCGGKNYRVV